MKNKHSFKDLGIIEPILKSIKEQHITEPTEIQTKTIPHILKNKDVIGGSKTGSGKTLTFGSGIIQRSTHGNGIQALILVPTRELAQQVARAIRTFSRYKRLNVVTIYGGLSINPQIEKLIRADVVVGTPGRILDHINRNTINLTQVDTLVLDEADMMFDMGFLYDVESIIKYVPKQRQTLLFSATINDDIFHITKRHMNDPVKISVEEYVDPSKLKQIYYDVSNNMKFSLLVHLLKEEKEGIVMIFCNTRSNTDFIERNLKINGIKCSGIHGGLTQNRREKIIEEFHGGKMNILACTDVAARGLDIKNVTHVYNYDTCKDPKQYIHRIGRTARAGKNGKAITLLSDRDHENFSRVLDTNDVEILNEETPRVERAKISFKTSPRRGGHNRHQNRERSNRRPRRR